MVLFFACNKENTDISKQIIIIVDSETQEYINWGSDTPVEGLKIKESEGADWTVMPLNCIEGFEYEMGNEYRLLVLKTTLANPPLDGSNVAYKLINIVDKNQVFIDQEFQQHNGEISQFATSMTQRQYAGSGYDIMGRYCGYNSVKEQVLDISKLREGTYTILDYEGIEFEAFQGANAVEFLKTIERNTEMKEVVPSENSGDLLFTGTVAGGHNWDIHQLEDSFGYSSQFSFVLSNSNYIRSKHVIRTLNGQHIPFDDGLFTDKLISDLQTLPANEIIEKYGTHIITRAYLGLAIHSMFSSINIAYDNRSSYDNMQYYDAKLRDSKHEATTDQSDAIKVNYGTTTVAEFKGGDSELMPLLITHNNVIVQSWNEADLSRWRSSYDDSNSTLLKLDKGGLIPIYSIISDETLKAEIKEATVKYIKSKQLDFVSTIPLTLYKELESNKYHYNKYLPDSTPVGMLGSLYGVHIAGTYPLYQYSNEHTERLSFDSNLADMKNCGVIGYCYKKQFNSSYDVLTEITNDTQYLYILNDNVEYSDDWQKTGVEIYVRKIDRLYKRGV